MTFSLSAIQSPPKRTRIRRRNGSAYKSFLGSGSDTRNRPIAFGDNGPCCHESPTTHLLIKRVRDQDCAYGNSPKSLILFDGLRFLESSSSTENGPEPISTSAARHAK